MRRTRAEIEKLTGRIEHYAQFTNENGEHLSYDEIARLVRTSKSRVAQLVTKLRAQNDRGK